ncbi:MAG: DUF402 domain-containing protein [Clostridia bacterium]|nr:DUF402 domain-containing protein [Clostridia bacterium]
MKLRDMYRTNWTRIKQRQYVSRACTIDGLPGRESLILIEDITSPLTVTSTGKAVKIVEKGYSWLQIAAENASWWLTVMFDEQDRLLQLYFDITGGNRFDNLENPTFRDMYLDVVMHDSGELFPLDEDELSDALRTGAVSPEEAVAAQAACDALCAFLRVHADQVIQRCRQSQKELKALLNANTL